MSEEQIDDLVDELKNDKNELREFIANTLEEADEEQIEALVDDLYKNPLDLREFIIQALED